MGLENVVIAHGKVYPSAELAELVPPELNFFNPELVGVDPFENGYDKSILDFVAYSRNGRFKPGTFTDETTLALKLAITDQVLEYLVIDQGWSVSDIINNIHRDQFIELGAKYALSKDGLSPVTAVSRWFSHHPNKEFRAAYSFLVEPLFGNTPQGVWKGKNRKINARRRVQDWIYFIMHLEECTLLDVFTKGLLKKHKSTPFATIFPDGGYGTKNAARAIKDVYNNSEVLAFVDAVTHHSDPIIRQNFHFLRSYQAPNPPNNTWSVSVQGKLRAIEAREEAVKYKMQREDCDEETARQNLTQKDFYEIKQRVGDQIFVYSLRGAMKPFKDRPKGQSILEAMDSNQQDTNELLHDFFGEPNLQFPRDRSSFVAMSEEADKNVDVYWMLAKLATSKETKVHIKETQTPGYVGLSTTLLLPGRDFYYFTDGTEAHADAKFVRFRGDIDNPNTIELNSADLQRVEWANAYKCHELKSLPHQVGKSFNKLEAGIQIAGLPVAFYDGNLYLGPGGREILSLDDESLHYFGSLSKKIMRTYSVGAFIAESDIDRCFSIKERDLTNTVSSFKLRERHFYSLFQMTQKYQPMVN